jgi:hypothetical protein
MFWSVVIVLSLLAFVVTFFAGAEHGKEAEARLMAEAINIEASFQKDVNNIIPWLQKRFPRLGKHLL